MLPLFEDLLRYDNLLVADFVDDAVVTRSLDDVPIVIVDAEHLEYEFLSPAARRNFRCRLCRWHSDQSKQDLEDTNPML